MLQRCAFKKRTCISLCHRFHFSRSPTLRGAFLPSTVSKSHTSQSIRVCSSHFLHSLLVFFVSGILVTFSKCQILALRHCACAHTSPPPKLHAHTHTHTHTHREQKHTLLAWSQAPLCSSTSEKLEPGIERRLWWILCSACQCCSFDLQPADDRSTLSS